MKKRCLAVLLALVLTLGAAPTGVWAAPASPAGEGARYGETVLDGAGLRLYRQLKEKIVQVANGSLGSSVFHFNTSGMGITYTGGTLRGVDNDLMMEALLADFPYELYWFNKSKGWTCHWSYDSGSGKVSSIEYRLHVYEEYAASSGSRKESYRLDPAKTRAAAASVKNAQALVDSCAGLSDYGKLAAYRDYICANNSYNLKAAEVGSDAAGGGPWQVVYVFDNDPGTNVVCEGYAKAFKYLCDLSEFTNDIACYMVFGNANGPHMWNIVRINGKSYLVDITNGDTDQGNAEPLDALFLAGAPGGTAKGYTIHIPRHELGGGSYSPAHDISYTYDSNTKKLYSDDILILDAAGYTPSASQPPAPSGFTDLPGWCAKEAQWAADSGVAKGTGGGKFSPGSQCTHEQILTFLWRAADRPAPAAKAPVAVGADYADAVNWAWGKGMVDESFQPKAPCTRADAVAYIYQAFDAPGAAAGSGFTDVDGDAPYAAAVDWAVGRGVANGYENGDGSFSFRPDDVCSRGAIVTLLYRAYYKE